MLYFNQSVEFESRVGSRSGIPRGFLNLRIPGRSERSMLDRTPRVFIDIDGVSAACQRAGGESASGRHRCQTGSMGSEGRTGQVCFYGAVCDGSGYRQGFDHL